MFVMVIDKRHRGGGGGGRVEWMVCHSNHKYFPQKLIPEMYRFPEPEQ